MQHQLDVAKAHQIMAKFRPIAPKPPLPSSPTTPTTPTSNPFKPRPSRPRKRARPGPIPNHPNPQPPSSSTPVEQDLLGKLQEQPRVITPQPLRPVGSSITVTSIITQTSSVSSKPKKAEEVEEELELEAFPAVVTGANNRVRLANSAYQAMVGQPECPWLETIGCSLGLEAPATARVTTTRRISGEVAMELPEGWEVPAGCEGFSCRVKVEWEGNNGKRRFVEAPCEVVRVWCDSKDYLLTWKIRADDALDSNLNLSLKD